MAVSESTRAPRVAILAYPNLCTFEFGCAVELFALPRPELSSWYTTDILAYSPGSEPGPVTLPAMGRINIQAPKLTSLDGYDMLVVPGWSGRDPDIPDFLRREIRALHARGGKLLSFCSGAFLLAACGVLDGREGATHWRYGDDFAALFPKVSWQQNVLYILRDNIGCSAGSAAGLDLGLAVIRADFGTEVANRVAKRLVIPPHREGGQAQYIERPLARENRSLSPVMDWALRNIAAPIDIDDMAAQANLSRRSFDRKFRQSTGKSPMDWLISQRLEVAKAMLEQKRRISLEQVAALSGFVSSLNLRHHFKKQLGISPSRYREQFY